MTNLKNVRVIGDTGSIELILGFSNNRYESIAIKPDDSVQRIGQLIHRLADSIERNVADVEDWSSLSTQDIIISVEQLEEAFRGVTHLPNNMVLRPGVFDEIELTGITTKQKHMPRSFKNRGKNKRANW